jgi:tetratricopeptide (TPR) repeat protein
MIPVLETAMAANPADAHAPYYLGDLLYDWQPKRAVELWQKSASLNADFPVVYRNLAMASSLQKGNPEAREKAIGYLEEAVSKGGSAMVLDDLDKLYEENGVPPEKRLALLEHQTNAVNRDDLVARELNLEIVNGQYQKAIALLKTRFFRAWEGGGRFSLGNSWINAHLFNGQRLAAGGQYQSALAAYEEALVFPVNLQEAKGNVEMRNAEIFYRIGTAYEALGQKDKAQQAFREASESTATVGPGETVPSHRPLRPARGIAAGAQILGSALYYQARALEKLGQASRADALYKQLCDTGAAQIADAHFTQGTDSTAPIPADMRSRLGDAHYLAALGYLGLKDQEKARQELSAALRISPDHLMAKTAIAAMGY